MTKKIDVFISYRRKGGGFETANLIHDRLTQVGYKVFMDIENLRSGKFNEQLYRQIDNCKDFIVVLTPDSLERCKNEDDWVRLEIAHAIKSDKNIIPIFLRNFKFPDEPLPEDIEEIKNYEGIEASQELFSAFLEKLKTMLLSKRYITWNRIRKQLLFIILPVLILAGTLLFIHYYNKQKEQAQLEQVCKQVVSEISAGFVFGNFYIEAIQDANKHWKEYHLNLSKINDPIEKQRLKTEFSNYIQFKLKEIGDTIKLPEIKLTPAHEELLAKNKISVENIKATKIVFLNNSELISDYLNKISYWLNTPENSWPNQIDEGFDNLALMSVEMINSNIYDFNELIIEMPESVQEVFNKFLPSLTNYTAEMNFYANKKELEAKESRSLQKCNVLLQNYSTIVGNENMRVKSMENTFDSLKALKKIAIDKARSDVQKSPEIDSMKKVVSAKKKIVREKQAEVDSMRQVLRASYQRILTKCSFDKSEDSGMMWGKIIHLAQFGYSQIIMENNCKAETERLKQEARATGQNPNTVEPITAVVSSKEIFQEVQKRLDLYLAYNKATDPNASVYIPAAKLYYKLVLDRKLPKAGVLIVGTKDNLPHPLLKTGDIVIEKKGESVALIDTYFNLNKKYGENNQKIIRFVNGKKTQVTGTIPADCKVLVGVMNLWEEK